MRSTWQLNPALSIEFNSSQNKLQIGLMSPNSVEVTEGTESLLKLVRFLSKCRVIEKERLLDSIAQIYTENPEDVFDDLRALSIIRPNLDSESRYSRHELYYGFSGAPTDTQDQLSRKSVLLIGVGGIGSTCAMLLAAAGVGELILADSDRLEISNLTRTTLFEMSDIGEMKIERAAERLRLRNPEVNIKTLSHALEEESFASFEKIFAHVDLVILSGDSGPEVHHSSYILSKRHNTPLINAGYIEHCGIVGPLTVGQSASRERDLFFSSTETEQVNVGYKAASYGPLNSLVSSIAVNEVIRFFSGLEVQTLNRRLVIDSFTYEQSWECFQ